VLGWAYDPVKRFWFKGNVKLGRMYWPILEVFDYGMYKLLSVKDRVVVDVGAFVGDSAIYFALKGARKVIKPTIHVIPEVIKPVVHVIPEVVDSFIHGSQPLLNPLRELPNYAL
jgi:hypothetical protein